MVRVPFWLLFVLPTTAFAQAPADSEPPPPPVEATTAAEVEATTAAEVEATTAAEVEATTAAEVEATTAAEVEVAPVELPGPEAAETMREPGADPALKKEVEQKHECDKAGCPYPRKHGEGKHPCKGHGEGKHPCKWHGESKHPCKWHGEGKHPFKGHGEGKHPCKGKGKGECDFHGGKGKPGCKKHGKGHHGRGHGGAALRMSNGFTLSLDGYLRLEGATIVPDRFFGIVMPSRYKRESGPNVGRYDGFGLGGARLNLRASYGEKLYVRLGFDGAVATFDDRESPVGEYSTGLKDAYMRYTFAPSLVFFAGRFKPPFDVEELTSTENQVFVHRSLESRGVARHEGPHTDMFGQADVGGFAPGRQIGLMLGGGFLGNFGYSVAVTNGNSGDKTLNDNDILAVYTRIQGTWGGPGGDGDDEEGPATYGVGDGVTVGVSSFYNETSTGLPGTLLRDRIVGAGIDVSAMFNGFLLQGQLLRARTTPVSRDDAAEPVLSFGGHATVGVQIPNTGFFPAYRFALLDPQYVTDEVATALTNDVDRVMHHTLGVRYQPGDMPLSLHLEYTHSIEQGGRAVHNDRVEVALQVTFK